MPCHPCAPASMRSRRSSSRCAVAFSIASENSGSFRHSVIVSSRPGKKARFLNESTHSFGGSASQTSILCVFIRVAIGYPWRVGDPAGIVKERDDSEHALRDRWKGTLSRNRAVARRKAPLPCPLIALLQRGEGESAGTAACIITRSSPRPTSPARSSARASDISFRAITERHSDCRRKVRIA